MLFGQADRINFTVLFLSPMFYVDCLESLG